MLISMRIIITDLEMIWERSSKPAPQRISKGTRRIGAIPASETETYSIYRVSAAAKSLPLAAMLDSSIWTEMQNDQDQLKLNTHVLIEIMKLRKSFAILATVKAHWKIVQANARRSDFSIRYCGDRRDGKVSTIHQTTVDETGLYFVSSYSAVRCRLFIEIVDQRRPGCHSPRPRCFRCRPGKSSKLSPGRRSGAR
jgi:hypothetical protein